MNKRHVNNIQIVRVFVLVTVLFPGSYVFALDADPLHGVKDQVYSDLCGLAAPTATRYSSDDYLSTLNGIVGFFKGYQQTTGDVSSGLGSILDPYKNREFQYSTPYYAYSGSVLYISGYDASSSFLESVCLALDRSLYELATDSCADNHSNFFTVPCVLAYENLKDHVTATRKSQWENYLTSVSSYDYVSSTPNWMVTASCGEFLRFINGFTTDTTFMETYLNSNMSRMTLEGMYRDDYYPNNPLAYDAFTRLNLGLILERGYGDYSSFPGNPDLGEYLGRGAWTSLLMQSPWGETPIGGRSAQHQWNETEMCFIYEVYADKMYQDGDLVAAGAFKRAAHLAYSSLLRWVRPSGELWIVKNRIDPSSRFGYESYSSHSQYNMWAAGFLALAWQYANESIVERTTPAEIGGFAFEIPDFNKVFANCHGLYVELDVDPSSTYNTAGLIRMHKTGVEPFVCPSASTSNVSGLDGDPRLGMGIGWETSGGWTSLAQITSSNISSYDFVLNSVSSQAVDFTVTYNFSGVDSADSVTENYVLEPDKATVNSSVAGSTTRTKMRYAGFVYDGQREFTVGYDTGFAQTKYEDSLMTMKLISDPATVFERTYSYVNSRNGYLEAIEGVVDDTSISYTLEPQIGADGSDFVAAHVFSKYDYYGDISAYEIASADAGVEQSGNVIENSYDDDPVTRWANTGYLSSAWVEYDLGAAREIDQIYIHFYSGDTRTFPLSIEIDGVEVWSGETTTSQAGWTVEVPSTIGQVVTVSLSGANSDGHYWFSIYETRIGKTIATCDDIAAFGLTLLSDLSGPTGSSDCVVDVYDVIELAEQWLASEPGNADISGANSDEDGAVNVMDFCVMASQWLNSNDPEE